ncbi:hypothetical protein EKK58_10105 [Candidatus Dependentiae bacterium]|nr:MAG: hypothetical protein EKK58_10105 [Candidatus Dependentiae bacterium]
MKIGDLFVQIFVKTETTKLKDFVSALGDLRMSSLLNAVGLEGVYQGITKIMSAANSTALAINNFSKTTGQSAQDLQKWSLVAAKTGQDAGVVAGSVTHLVDSVTRLKKFGEGSGFWMTAFPGLDPTKAKNEFELLSEIGKRLSGLDVSEKRFKLGLLGLDPSLIPILDYIVNNQAEMSRYLTVNNDQLKQFEKHQSNISQLTNDWRVLIVTIGTSLRPVVDFIVQILDGIVQIVTKLSPLIGPLMTLGGVALGAAGVANPLLGAATKTAAVGLITTGAAITAGDLMNAFSKQPATNRTNNNHLTVNVSGNNSKEISENVMREYEQYMIQKAQYQEHLPNN